MSVRRQLEEREELMLSPYAMRSNQSAGRARPLSPDDLRTDFQRDRDRILHSKSFRRLKHKTQCFLSPEGDHYRTRLTHTLEVSQVARTLARSLFLNEDLAEAISLGHDLGHTPFGHMGERTLNRLMPGGFKHRVQSLRVVEKLEDGGRGLNLTFEVRDGILNHSGAQGPATLEGRLVHLADRIAYINHDIDDAIRAGVLTEVDLPAEATDLLGHTHGARIDSMIRDVVAVSAGKPLAFMSEPVQRATDQLRAFLYERVYKSDWAQREEQKADLLITELFSYGLSHPEELPEEYRHIMQAEGPERGVCDYIASMTDRYAVGRLRQWMVPAGFELG